MELKFCLHGIELKNRIQSDCQHGERMYVTLPEIGILFSVEYEIMINRNGVAILTTDIFYVYIFIISIK